MQFSEKTGKYFLFFTTIEVYVLISINDYTVNSSSSE